MELFQIVGTQLINPNFLIFNTVIIFLMGACIGSFLNVIIFRMPKNESIIKVPSHCQNCKKPLKWYDNIPIFAWLLLRGKCRFCGSKIATQYVIIEFFTALIITALWIQHIQMRHFFWEDFIRNAVLISACIAIIVIDFRHRIIPNKINYFLLIFGLAWAYFFPANWSLPFDRQPLTDLEALTRASLAVIIIFLFLWTYRFIGNALTQRDIFGLGDLKLLMAFGAILGGSMTFSILLVGSILASIVGIYLTFARSCFKKRKVRFNILLPFGPFCAFTAIVAIFFERLFYPLIDRFNRVSEYVTIYLAQFSGGF